MLTLFTHNPCNKSYTYYYKKYYYKEGFQHFQVELKKDYNISNKEERIGIYRLY